MLLGAINILLLLVWEEVHNSQGLHNLYSQVMQPSSHLVDGSVVLLEWKCGISFLLKALVNLTHCLTMSHLHVFPYSLLKHSLDPKVKSDGNFCVLEYCNLGQNF